ncbi:hypothetical protein DCS_00149 [Drechmeria coniospora]|uniref:Uncharacterized protein n=1 Tax=Drechmeria coniospora TaxID=98403 RepID=A0A151GPU1_DRECN|nr:hypothetical protein DCS_00149 [Drechmeria coniospora]KYK59022.1 hypothetical protein DCS_00149 [Drechmeria coniospora]
MPGNPNAYHESAERAQPQQSLRGTVATMSKASPCLVKLTTFLSDSSNSMVGVALSRDFVKNRPRGRRVIIHKRQPWSTVIESSDPPDAIRNTILDAGRQETDGLHRSVGVYKYGELVWFQARSEAHRKYVRNDGTERLDWGDGPAADVPACLPVEVHRAGRTRADFSSPLDEVPGRQAPGGSAGPLPST